MGEEEGKGKGEGEELQRIDDGGEDGFKARSSQYGEGGEEDWPVNLNYESLEKMRRDRERMKWKES